MPTFALVPSDVEGFLDELWAFQSVLSQSCNFEAKCKTRVEKNQ
jgi:hypothetical protein